jgi:hypothetical protein
MQSFTKILNMCLELSKGYPDVVFIGGVAVYVHLADRALATIPLEVSHDADFMISFADYGSLKDEEEITPTPRLAKHQMIVDGVEFDVYVERLNSLVVPYDEVYAYSVVIDNVRVAALEHLLVLKLEALAKRHYSSKGSKDRRDVAKIGLLLGQDIKSDLIVPYMRDDLLEHLYDTAKSTVFFELCARNAHTAKKVKSAFLAFVESVGRAVG